MLLYFRDLSPSVRMAAEPAAAASARTSNVDENRSGLRFAGLGCSTFGVHAMSRAFRTRSAFARHNMYDGRRKRPQDKTGKTAADQTVVLWREQQQ